MTSGGGGKQTQQPYIENMIGIKEASERDQGDGYTGQQ